MKPNTDRPVSRLAQAKRRFVGALLLLCCHGIAMAQSPGIGALMQGSGRAARAHEGAARDRAAPVRTGSHRDARARTPRHRLERDAVDRTHRGRLSAEERRRLRQSLYEFGREMYHGS